ncbi:4-hydroxyacetophenone monooxygenase [Microdochium bolleyi]|uniref:4-hydroxyacetophenone monooxygenase n=1 Tax=Microdochium bolleyi TaxID=196109 RepID=A0A136IXB8_9PEZI|nr:4-hydroxyacetophenone monooxygenase [Microdochium bolleyi]
MTINDYGPSASRRVLADGTLPGPIRHGPVKEAVATTTIAVSDEQDISKSPESRRSAVYPAPTFALLDRHIDEPRELKVAVIGAGLAGITAGILLPAKVPGIQLTIFEKNSDVGGVWYENVYPGVRCDVPAHVYQSSVEGNPQWSEKFAQGAEIREYWQALARKHKVYEHLRLSHEVKELQWAQDTGKWNVEVEELTTNERSVEKFDFVLTAIGRFNSWKLPEYPGLDEYRGHLRHVQDWDPSFKPAGKRIAIIGNGASGIQLVSNLQKTVAHLDHYARNPTWIAPSFSGDDTSIEPIAIDPDAKASFHDPEQYLAFRKLQTDKYWRRIKGWLKGHQDNTTAQQEYTDILHTKLSGKPELVESLTPSFSPHCRRLTPGPGYLEALAQDHVEYINTPIKRFTPTGIETLDGKHRAVDAVFCATGSHGQLPLFKIHGSHGAELGSMWQPRAQGSSEEGYGFPYTYLGVGTPGFPNLGFLIGPNGSGRSGTVPYAAEIHVSFYAKLLRKMSREGIRTVQPRRDAADDFVRWSDAFFSTTVLSEGCSSWYNGGQPGGRIYGLWPGSAAHLASILREPRWEDWEYDYVEVQDPGTGALVDNRFAWYFGNGTTKKELDPETDMTSYLKLPEHLDLRDLHESWWSIP